MTQSQAGVLKAALRKAFAQTIEEVGLDALKATSWFGSNDAAYKAKHLKQAA